MLLSLTVKVLYSTVYEVFLGCMSASAVLIYSSYTRSTDEDAVIAAPASFSQPESPQSHINAARDDQDTV